MTSRTWTLSAACPAARPKSQHDGHPGQAQCTGSANASVGTAIAKTSVIVISTILIIFSFSLVHFHKNRLKRTMLSTTIVYSKRAHFYDIAVLFMCREIAITTNAVF
jgi:hypothetical protein